jgi:hypothetical protein
LKCEFSSVSENWRSIGRVTPSAEPSLQSTVDERRCNWVQLGTHIKGGAVPRHLSVYTPPPAYYTGAYTIISVLMQARSEYSDNETVVGGPSSSYPRNKASMPDVPEQKTYSATTVHNMTKFTDYLSDDKPFLVKIEKDGLPAALQKLNDNLIAVCTLMRLLLYKVVAYTLNLQAKHGKILSSKVSSSALEWLPDLYA